MTRGAPHPSVSPWQRAQAIDERHSHAMPKYPLRLRAAVIVGLGAASWTPILLLLS
jgi:hypothetical protein